MKLIALFISFAAVMIAADPGGLRPMDGHGTEGRRQETGTQDRPAQGCHGKSRQLWQSPFHGGPPGSSGQAELHETQADIFIVESGEGTLVVGGTVVDPKTISPHEVRGTSVKDGVTKQLRPGDIVHIAAKTPHQVMVPAGKQITYFVAKVDTP